MCEGLADHGVTRIIGLAVVMIPVSPFPGGGRRRLIAKRTGCFLTATTRRTQER